MVAAFLAKPLLLGLLRPRCCVGRALSWPTGVLLRRYKHKESSVITWDLESVCRHISKAETEKIVVMAGAGISTPSGLIDFRSPGTGLYVNLQKYNLPYPEAIFDIGYFHMDQRPFFAIAKELYPGGKYAPNIAHRFVRLLQDKGKLLRMYTQNIDGLERLAGIRPELLVEAHGSFSTATCTSCGERCDGEKIKDAIFRDEIPQCTVAKCNGIIKPDIVFFGEQLPKRFWLHVEDMREANLLIVMGTSLEDEAFASAAELVPDAVPRLLVNRDVVGTFTLKQKRDVSVVGDIVGGVQSLVDLLRWNDDMKRLTSDQPTPTPPRVESQTTPA